MSVIIHTEQFRIDGMENVLTGLGRPEWDPFSGLRLTTRTGTLPREAQAELIRRYGLLRKAVYNIPEAATAEWGRPTAVDDVKNLSALAEGLKHIPVTCVQDNTWVGRRILGGARAAFREGLIQAFKTGNGALLMDVDDDQRFDEPIKYDQIKELRRIWVLSRWRISPDVTQVGPDGSYTHYWLYGVGNNLSLRQHIHGLKVHHSRVLWIQGVEDDNAYNQGCDVSILEPLLDAFAKFYSAIEGAARMIVDFDVIVHKIEGYLDALAAKGEEAERKFRERIRVNQRARSVYRGHIIDKDGEEISHDTRQVGGYSELLDRLKMYLLGSTDYPPAILFGEFSAGLDASGRSQEEKQLWNETIGRIQINKLEALITGNTDEFKGLLPILALSQRGPTKGKIPKGLSWQWNPVYRPTPEEQAQLEESRAGIIQTLHQIDPRFSPNAILSHYGGTDYTPNITLTEEYIKALQKEAKDTEKPEPEALPSGQEANALPGQEEEQEAEGEEFALEEFEGIIQDSEDIVDTRFDAIAGEWRFDVRKRVCNSPDDKDKAGRRCGKRATRGKAEAKAGATGKTEEKSNSRRTKKAEAKTAARKRKPKAAAKTKTAIPKEQKQKIKAVKEALKEKTAATKSELFSTPASKEGVSLAKKFAGKLPDRGHAEKNFQELGRGIEGPVFRNGKEAIKYLPKIRADRGDFERFLPGLSAAGDLGISPKILKVDLENSAFAIEFLEGYELGLTTFDLDSKEAKPFLESTIRNTMTAHKAGYHVEDMKEDNIMFNPKTGETKFIDQGGFFKETPENMAGQLLDTYGDRPMLADTIKLYVNKYGSRQQKQAYKKIRREYDDSSDIFADSKPRDDAGLHKRTMDLLSEMGFG